MARIELVVDAGCPAADEARAALRQALAAVGADPAWTEWDRNAASCPPHARGYGSPTILVDGRDVAGSEPTGAPDCCRVYPAEGRVQRAPPVAAIVRALGG